MTDTVVIVGAGHAAGQAVASLRQKGFTGEIILIGDEPYIPYQRPPLSKKFLAGELEVNRLYYKPEKYYPGHDVTVRLNTRVDAIDTAKKTVTLSDGETIPYTKLLLTTGSRVRKLPIPGNELNGIHYLRTIDDVLGMQPAFKEGARLVIVGGGYIGLEVAAVATQRGLDVTVLETEERVMSRVVAPEVSDFYQKLHSQAGVKLELGRRVESFAGSTALEGVRCADGHTVPADLCLVGIGIQPNTELASEAGIACDNGILVDENCQTSASDVYSAGDCTRHPNGILNAQLRLESVHNAIEQGKTAAASMCGESAPYNQVPWFWSDQYDVKLQIVGLSSGYDRGVVRGNPDEKAFALFYLLKGKLLAVDAINSPREFMLGKKLIAAGACFDADELADEKKDFRTMADAALAAAEN